MMNPPVTSIPRSWIFRTLAATSSRRFWSFPTAASDSSSGVSRPTKTILNPAATMRSSSSSSEARSILASVDRLNG